MSSVTACSSSDAEANWSDALDICRIVSRRLCCIVRSELRSMAGSSWPVTWISWVSSPAATRLATSTASAMGATMLRVSRMAMIVISSRMITSTASTTVTASVNASLLCCAAA
ncbi:hypothetical protein D3C80_1551920 [compost metagenome]